LYMTKWSRPEITNNVRELSSLVQKASMTQHMKALYRVMQHCTETYNRGLMIEPTESWDGDKSVEFIISGHSDSDFAKNVKGHKSISGCSTFLCGAPVSIRSKMQDCVMLPLTEAVLVAATQSAHDVLSVIRVLESMEMTVKKSIILEVDNKGSKI
jgi:hypothetical protein